MGGRSTSRIRYWYCKIIKDGDRELEEKSKKRFFFFIPFKPVSEFTKVIL